MAIKILISALCLIYVYVAIKTIIKIHKDTKRADEILEQLIMELVWSQQRQESIEVLEQEPYKKCSISEPTNEIGYKNRTNGE